MSQIDSINLEKNEQETNSVQPQEANPNDLGNDLDPEDLDIDQQMSDFLAELEGNVYDEDMLFKFPYLVDDEGNTINDHHQVYKVAVDFIDELKKPISREDSTHCFNHMQYITDVIYNLLEYQDDVPDDEAEIENWRNIMTQSLLVAKTFFIFLKNEKNIKCIEIAKSLLNFSFNVEIEGNLESKIFSVLPEFGTFLSSNEPIFSLESSTGSGKTRCVPFFLSIRSFQENFKHPFMIMTQPSKNIIDSKVKDFNKILKNVILLTEVDDIIKFCQKKEINQGYIKKFIY